MDLVFFGSGAFGLPTLRHLHLHHKLHAIVTQPPKPAGRGSRLTPTPVAQWASTNAPDVPLLQPERVATLTDHIRDIPAEAWVVIAYGQKLSPRLLDQRFAINLHASLLPRWRGAAPINWAILAGDPITGNSIITLADRMDAGAVLARSTRPIEPTTTTGELHDLLASDGPDLVLSVLAARAQGRELYEAQDELLVTLAPKLSKADGRLDFSLTADQCRCRVHGLNPWPGTTVDIAGQPVRIHLVQALSADDSSTPASANTRTAAQPEPHHEPPGTLISARDGLVRCGGGSVLRLLSVQPPGGRAMEWSAYANGRRQAGGLEDGLVLTSHIQA